MGSMSIGIMFGASADQVPERVANSTPPVGVPKPHRTSGGADVVGFWVAVHNGDDKDVPDLRGVAFDAVATTQPYAKSLKKAESAWRRFALWSHKEHAALLPEPRLWVALVEVG